MAQIDLNPQVPVQQDTGTVPIDPGSPTSIVPSVEVAKSRAAKASFGLSNMTGQPEDEIFSQVIQGQEDRFRDFAASQANYTKSLDRDQFIQSIASRYPDATALAKDKVATTRINNLPEPTDPNSVIEEYFSKNYIEPAHDLSNNFVQKTQMNDAFLQDQEGTQGTLDAAHSILPYKQFVGNRLQISHEKLQNQGWAGYIADWAKGLSQIYSEVKLRGWTGQGWDWSRAIGKDLDQQRQDLWSMPYDQFKTKFNSIMDSLEKDNPQLAVEFASAMYGSTQQEIDSRDAMTFMGLPSDATIAAGFAKSLFTAEGKTLGLALGDIQLPKMDKAPNEFPNFSAFRKAARAAGYKDSELELGNSIDFANKRFVRKAAQDVINSTTNVDLKPGVATEDVKKAAAVGRGDLKEAAVQDIAKEILTNVRGSQGPGSAFEAIPSFLKSDADRVGLGAQSNEIANRVRQDTLSSQHVLEEAVNNLVRVQRTPAAVASQDVARLATDAIKRKYSGPNSTVLHVDYDNKVWLPASNRYMVPIYQGSHDAEIFKRKSQAISHAKLYGLPLQTTEFEIPGQDINNVVKQEGLGWTIRSWVPLDETQDFIRDTLLDMPDAYSGPRGSVFKPATWLNPKARGGTNIPYLIDPLTGQATKRSWDVVQAFFNSGPRGAFPLRSPTEVLSPVEQEQREVTTFGPTKLMDIFQDNNKLIHAGNTKEFKRTLVTNQSMPNPDKEGEYGYFFKDIGELQKHYQTSYGRLPSEAETRAYFANKNNYEMERSLMSLTMMSNKSSRGFMSYRISKTKLAYGTTSRSIDHSDWFDARPLDNLPRTNDPVLVNTKGRQYVKRANSLTEEETEKLANGEYKVIELWNREERPLHNYTNLIPRDSEPRYVITDAMENRQLQMQDQVPRRGGGHWIYEYRKYMKQANILHDPVTDTHNYRGDTTAMPFMNEVLGEGTTKKFNQIREFLKADDEQSARNLVRNWGVAGLDFDNDILPMFRATKDVNGVAKPPRFNLNEEFHLIDADSTIMDMDKTLAKKYGDKLVDFTRSGNTARSAKLNFTQERDAYGLHTIEDAGSIRNPVYQYRPAKLLDPLDSINRSMSHLANSMFMEDYKRFAVEHWMETAKNWLDVDTSDMRQNPFYWFQRADFKKGTPENIKAVLMGNRKLIQSFVGRPSDFQAVAQTVTSSLMSSMYKMGVKESYIPFEKIPFIANPFQAIRALTFDLKLGLGSLPSFFTQITAFSNVHAINPRMAAASTMATFLHPWSLLTDPAVLEELDRRVSTGRKLIPDALSVSFKPGQLKEAINLSNKTGFFRVGAEHAMVDSLLMDRGVRTSVEAVRYWGRTAFKEGAQAVRRGAFFSAYLEFRDINPTRLMTRADEHWILSRAAMLDHNMSRAANSALNSGAMSVPGQFYTYARNLSEMFYGKRLTVGEKARLFTINSVLWGIPAGGVGLAGLPLGDWVNKEAIKQGYIPGNSVASTTAIDGLMATVGAYISGKGNFQAGTVYDMSKFGVKGWDPIDNLFDPDKSFFDFLGGASYSVLKDTWGRIGPGSNLFLDTASLIKGDQERFPIKAMDIADLFKESAGFSYGVRAIIAMNTGIWMSNNNTPIDETKGFGDILTRFTTGLVPSDVANITADESIRTERADVVKHTTQQYARNYNLAMLAKKAGDDNGYTEYMTKANTWLMAAGVPPDERMRIVKEVMSRKETLIKSLDWGISHQNVPENQQEQMQQRDQEQEDLRQKREQ